MDVFHELYEEIAAFFQFRAMIEEVATLHMVVWPPHAAWMEEDALASAALVPLVADEMLPAEVMLHRLPVSAEAIVQPWEENAAAGIAEPWPVTPDDGVRPQAVEEFGGGGEALSGPRYTDERWPLPAALREDAMLSGDSSPSFASPSEQAVERTVPNVHIEFSGNIERDLDLDQLISQLENRLRQGLFSGTDLSYNY